MQHALTPPKAPKALPRSHRDARRALQHSLALGVLAWACLAGAAPPQEPSPRTPPLRPGDRFLFLVDTSSGMSRLGHASRQAMFDLIYTGLNGHMRSGDTLGVWTFSDEPHPGKLPMQIWETNTLDLASRVGRFLRDQSHGKRADLGKAIEAATAVVKLVQDVTVLVISDGSAPIANTPFDEAINAVFKERSASARQNKRPLITALVARRGNFVRWSVTWPEQEVPLPERASRPALATVSTHRPPAAALVVRPSVAPIIITNSRPRKLPEAASPSVPPPLAPTAAVLSLTNEPVVPPPPSTPAIEPPSPTESSAHSGSNILAAPPPSIWVRTAAPPVTLRPKDTALVGGSSTPVPVNAAQGSVAFTPTSNVPSVTLPRPEPLPVAAREPSASAPSGPNPAGEMLAVTPAIPPLPSGSFSPLWMFAIGVGLLLAAVGLAILFLLRLRQAAQPSLISQSMSRKSARPRLPPNDS